MLRANKLARVLSKKCTLIDSLKCLQLIKLACWLASLCVDVVVAVVVLVVVVVVVSVLSCVE